MIKLKILISWLLNVTKLQMLLIGAKWHKYLEMFLMGYL